MLCPLLVSLALFQSPVAGATLWLGDWNADALPDVLHAPAAGPARLLENQGDGTFLDVSARCGLPALERVRQVLFTDLDGDGRTDLLAVAGGRVAFLGGSDGVLVDRTILAGLDALEGVAELRPLQADADGLADLWVRAAAGDQLLRQTPAGSFAAVDLGAAPDAVLTLAARPDDPPVVDPTPPAPEGEDAERSRPGRRPGPAVAASTSFQPSISTSLPDAEEEPRGLQSLAFCNTMIRDKSTGNCLYVNTVPTLGEVLPLSTALNVDLAGNVGMGTVAPTHKLTIQGVTNDDVLRLVGTQGTFQHGARLNFGDGDFVHLSEPLDDKLEIAAAGGTNFVGRVGIGQPDPLWALDVSQPQAVARLVSTASGGSGSALELRNDTVPNSTLGEINFVDAAGTIRGQVRFSAPDEMVLSHAGGDQVRLTADRLYSTNPVHTTSPLPYLPAVQGRNLATGGFATGVRGEATGTGAGNVGVSGYSNGVGVVGNTTSPASYGVYSYGDFGGTGAKYFVQPHPADASKEIRFVCLEGNESGTYFRGTARLAGGRAVIDVPEEFGLVSESAGLTVQLTPVGAPADLWLVSRDLERIVVAGAPDVEFDYFVNGVRRGFANHRPMRPNTAFVPRERGVPYGTQYPDDLRRILVENGTLNPDFTPNEETAARLGWKLEEPEPLQENQ